MVLDKGKIIEFDSPESLLSNKSSVFYSLAIDAGVKI
jgi:ABC-type multidrug transport system fused ATPase/permease subunit